MLLTAGCATGDFNTNEIGQKTSKIVGGHTALHSDYPSIVALTVYDNGPYCTGTLVRPDLIITAAHCVKDIPEEKLFIVYGYEIPAEAPFTARHGVFKIVINPEYPAKTAPYDDIALVVLNSPIATNSCAPILPPDNFDLLLNEGDTVTIAGYGRHVDGVSGPAGTLYAADTPVYRRFYKEMVIGGNNEPNLCFGDSGGPAYVDYDGTMYVTGISARITDDKCLDKSITTLPGDYIDWISDTYNYVLSEKGEERFDPDLSTHDCPLVGEPFKKPIKIGNGCSVGKTNNNTLMMMAIILGALILRRK